MVSNRWTSTSERVVRIYAKLVQTIRDARAKGNGDIANRVGGEACERLAQARTGTTGGVTWIIQLRGKCLRYNGREEAHDGESLSEKNDYPKSPTQESPVAICKLTSDALLSRSGARVQLDVADGRMNGA